MDGARKVHAVVAAMSLQLMLLACDKTAETTSSVPADSGAMPAVAQSLATPATDVAAGSATTKVAAATVKAVDATLGTITLAHGPIESLGWPAMTMPFKATPEQLAVVKVGQVVDVEFQAEGMNATITRLGPAQ